MREVLKMRYCTSDQDTMTKTLPLSMAKYNANNQKKNTHA